MSGTAGGGTQQVTYDTFGNIKTIGGSTLSPSATTNRLPSSLATYAANGAVTAFGGDLFDLDPFGMVQAVHDPTYAVKYWAFVYTADDERIWKYDMGPANTSWWKVRDLGGKVLSEFVNVGPSWTATSSYIYRDGTLLGRYAPGTSYPNRWFAVDHLGTPRRTYGESGITLEAVSYYPFGGLATATQGPADETLRFTGHERDSAIAGGIDYMHARFYAPAVGRFLSVDPHLNVGRNLATPQRWNRYAYAMNNPIRAIDPDGRDTLLVIVSTGDAADEKGGHAAMWVGNNDDGFGISVFGGIGFDAKTPTPEAVVKGYLATGRDVRTYLLRTSAEEDARMISFMKNDPTRAGIDDTKSIAFENCSTAIANTLTAGGVIARPGAVAVEITGNIFTPNGLKRSVTSRFGALADRLKDARLFRRNTAEEEEQARDRR